MNNNAAHRAYIEPRLCVEWPHTAIKFCLVVVTSHPTMNQVLLPGSVCAAGTERRKYARYAVCLTLLRAPFFSLSDRYAVYIPTVALSLIIDEVLAVYRPGFLWQTSESFV